MTKQGFTILVGIQVLYLASPATSWQGVHGWLQAEGMIAFIAHVTHQHLGIFAWVPVVTQIPQRMLSPWTYETKVDRPKLGDTDQNSYHHV